MQKIRSLEDGDRVQIVFDIDVSDYIVSAGKNLIAFNYPLEQRVSNLKMEKSVDLWLVRRVNEKSAYALDPGFDAKRFNSMAIRFGVQKSWSSSKGNYELHHALVLSTGNN